MRIIVRCSSAFLLAGAFFVLAGAARADGAEFATADAAKPETVVQDVPASADANSPRPAVYAALKRSESVRVLDLQPSTAIATGHSLVAHGSAGEPVEANGDLGRIGTTSAQSQGNAGNVRVVSTPRLTGATPVIGKPRRTTH